MMPSSLGVSFGSGDSLHGLKFGKKIYFEDGASCSATKAPPSPATAPLPPVKKGKWVATGGGQHQQPPGCQVEGCKEDLTGTKAYYCRHKVCKKHSRDPKVIVSGLEQRFCQQCSRFHQLQEFDQSKRSCRRRLAGHNERRRKPHTGSSGSRFGRLSSSLYEEPSSFRSFLTDYSYPRAADIARDVCPTIRAGDRVCSYQCQGLLEPPLGTAAGGYPYLQGSPEVAALFSAPGQNHAAASDSSCALSLLSNQPWGNNSSRNQTPTISGNSWDFLGNGGRANSHEMQHEMGLLVGTHEAGHAHFSGELELALQGNVQCLHHYSTRPYSYSGSGVNWSL